jgi:hypothetical protein
LNDLQWNYQKLLDYRTQDTFAGLVQGDKGVVLFHTRARQLFLNFIPTVEAELQWTVAVP